MPRNSRLIYRKALSTRNNCIIMPAKDVQRDVVVPAFSILSAVGLTKSLVEYMSGVKRSECRCVECMHASLDIFTASVCHGTLIMQGRVALKSSPS
jgi:hypothetical protein